MTRWRVTYKTSAGVKGYKLVEASHRKAAATAALNLLRSAGLGKSRILGVSNA